MIAATRSACATFSIVCVVLIVALSTSPARRSPILAQQQAEGDWTAYGRDAGGERYSPLDDIRPGNVTSLEVAWTFRTGDAY
jgi:quinoprotein glucose dehydrogenase